MTDVPEPTPPNLKYVGIDSFADLDQFVSDFFRIILVAYLAEIFLIATA